MQPIRSLFNEIQYELVKIILLNVFLSTVILFMVADLIALFFSMPLWYVIAASLIYFVIMMVFEVRKISIHHVEEKNPELREMLRTAKDNMGADSLMAHALFFEVLEKMKRVSSGTFLDFKKLMTKLGVIFVLAIVLVSIAFFNINISKFDNPFAKPMSAVEGFLARITGSADGSVGDEANNDVYGDPSMARLGDNQLIATVNPSLDSPDFNSIDPANPSNDPLGDLGGDGTGGFNAANGGYAGSGLSERDQERSYNYAKQTQG